MDRYANRDDLDIRAETYRMPVTRRGGLDLGTRRLALTAGFLTCGLVLVISVWSVLSNNRSATLPVIEPDRRPVRVKPENPGGLQVAGQNEDILSAEAGPRAGQLAPPPEAPAPQALRARQQAAEAAAAQAASPPAVQPVSLPPVSQVVPPSPPLVVTHPSTPAATAQPHPVPSQVATGRVQAQLAAVGSEQAAKDEWQRLSKRMPDVLSGRQPVLMKTERDGHTLWRVRTGGFADQAAASAFCGRVKAKGAGCSVATF